MLSKQTRDYVVKSSYVTTESVNQVSVYHTLGW
jgi:hypothetical protein